MQKIFDVVIVGGGASGLMCANFLKDKNKDFLIVEKSSLGKKILVTGNGRCNLSNKKIKLSDYNTDLVKTVISNFDNFKTLEYFKSIAVETFFDEEGRCYPISETAKDIRDALCKGVENKFLHDEVVKVTKNKYFELRLLSNGTLLAKKIVIACGTKNLPSILSDFNLNFQPQKPVLTGFIVKNFDKNLLGVRENVIVTSNECNFKEKGQVQFKKDGISGIVIFNLSAKSAKLNIEKFSVNLQLLPGISEDKVIEILKYRKNNAKNLLVKDVLISLVKPATASYILKVCKIKNLERKINFIRDDEISLIAQTLKALSFECIKPYDDFQVLSGGVDLSDLKNLESNTKGLYFCGEACNVYGVCGGYNLQWAWSSGKFVADRILSDL